jgi:hypothetical protein
MLVFLIVIAVVFIGLIFLAVKYEWNIFLVILDLITDIFSWW